MILRILLSLPLWLAYTLVDTVLDIVGLVLIPFLLLLPSAGRKSRYFPYPIDVWPGGWLTWIWGNEEDGISGPGWWKTRTNTDLAPGRSLAAMWADFRWSALRNPSNNIRFIPVVNPVIDPARVKYIRTLPGARTWRAEFTWQGIYSGLLVIFLFRGKSYRLWWGWKLKPEDRLGVSPDDVRSIRCGFATQLKENG